MRPAAALALALAARGALAPAARAEAPILEARTPELLLVGPEVDPLPFAARGYGVQLAVRHPALEGVRIAVASFSLDVPAFAAELGGNDGFEIRVRPSAALYVLYYFEPAGRDGFAVGGALRYLRLRYRHEAEAGEALVSELAPEAIAAYQWHPFKGGAARGLYLQPWLGLSVTALRDGDRVVGAREYEPLPVQPFFTVNIGWEFQLWP